MPTIGEIMRTYRELAEVYEARGESQMRDRFLVLAADSALTAGRAEEAERLRAALLRHNPNHLLRPYASLAEALKSTDIRNYITALRRSHPYERAEHLLATLSKNTGAAGPPRGRSGHPESEEGKVYRVRGDEAASARVEKPIDPLRPTPGAAGPNAAQEFFPYRPDRIQPRISPNEATADEDRDSRTSRWIAWILYSLLLAAALLVGALTLIRPWV